MSIHLIIIFCSAWLTFEYLADVLAVVLDMRPKRKVQAKYGDGGTIQELVLVNKQ